MTRENKLALIVGFGLVLVVGILISDHLSAAHRQEAAHLGGVIDPLNAPSGAQPATRLVEYQSTGGFGAARTVNHPSPRNETGHSPSTAQTGTQSNQSASAEIGFANDPITDRSRLNRHDTPSILASDGPRGGYEIQFQGTSQASAANDTPGNATARNGGLRTVTLDELADLAGVDRPNVATAASITFHHVQEGETLSTIAKKFYGTGAVIDQLAAANDITNPNLVQVGRRLNLPATLGRFQRMDATSQRDGSRASQSHNASAPRAQPQPQINAAPQTYTIQPGDTLSELSLRFLGTSRRWKELQNHNADVIPDPDRLRAGVVIRIPTR